MGVSNDQNLHVLGGQNYKKKMPKNPAKTPTNLVLWISHVQQNLHIVVAKNDKNCKTFSSLDVPPFVLQHILVFRESSSSLKYDVDRIRENVQVLISSWGISLG